jgi:hypothetical protein
LKRIVFVGDAHAGHRVGLTCPRYQSAIHGEQYHRIQVELWDYYSKVIKSLQPIDILVHNGDAIDGKGARSGATELIHADPGIQVEMAYEGLSIAEAGTYILTYGTPYHTGSDTDYERVLADRLGADIKGHQWIEVNGTTFDIKHKIGGSSVPYGKNTQISKDRLWNYIWSEYDEQPKSDVFIRSHVHYFTYCGEDNWLGIVLPALQGQGSKFGARQCSGIVHFGVVWVDCYDDGSYTWSRKILRARSQQQAPLHL